MKTDHSRVRGLLTEAITMLCKSSLTYRKEFCVQGLLGITLDKQEVFLIDINEQIKQFGLGSKDIEHSPIKSENNTSPRRRRRSGSKSPKSTVIQIKPELNDDNSADTLVDETTHLSSDDVVTSIETGKTTTSDTIDDKDGILSKSANPTIENVDFGDILASYNDPDHLNDYNNGQDIKPSITPQTPSIPNQSSNSHEEDDEDDDIVIVKEEKIDTGLSQQPTSQRQQQQQLDAEAIRAEALSYANAAMEQYDYYQQQQPQQYNDQFGGDVIYPNMAQIDTNTNLPGTSYDNWGISSQMTSPTKQTFSKTPQKRPMSTPKSASKMPRASPQQVRFFYLLNTAFNNT